MATQDTSQTGAIGQFVMGVSAIGGSAPLIAPVAFAPALSDLLLDAYSRIQIRAMALTANHMRDALMSSQLLLVEWSTKPNVPNLWKIQLFSTTLVNGQATYPVPSNVVGILDYYIRQLAIETPVDLSPSFTTSGGDTSVGVFFPNHGAAAGGFTSIVLPVAVGGLVLQGFYQVATVIDQDNLTIQSATPAVTTDGGGAVPTFSTAAGSNFVTVGLVGHGLAAGQSFAVQVTTDVGGLAILAGTYPIASVIDANNFVLSFPYTAGSSATTSENGGLAQIGVQPVAAVPQDLPLTPMGRSDYAMLPLKTQPGRPTSVWFDRQIAATITAWPVPDGSGPYVLFYYALTAINPTLVQAGVPVDVPYRFLEAFTAGLAAKLAEKYPPPAPNSIDAMETRAEKKWKQVTDDDVENVPMRITPVLNGYYR